MNKTLVEQIEETIDDNINWHNVPVGASVFGIPEAARAIEVICLEFCLEKINHILAPDGLQSAAKITNQISTQLSQLKSPNNDKA